MADSLSAISGGVQELAPLQSGGLKSVDEEDGPGEPVGSSSAATIAARTDSRDSAGGTSAGGGASLKREAASAPAPTAPEE